MVVGDRTMCIPSDSLVEQTPILRQVGASASDGAEEIAGQVGAAPGRVSRTDNQCVLDGFPVEGRRVMLRLRASFVSVAWGSPGSSTVRMFMGGW